jgi:hypothetical protein
MLCDLHIRRVIHDSDVFAGGIRRVRVEMLKAAPDYRQHLQGSGRTHVDFVLRALCNLKTVEGTSLNDVSTRIYSIVDQNIGQAVVRLKVHARRQRPYSRHSGS